MGRLGFLFHIKDKNITVIYKEKLSQAVSSIPIVMIDASSLHIQENRLIAQIPKKEIEQQINREELLQKIVEEYKTEQITRAKESAPRIS